MSTVRLRTGAALRERIGQRPITAFLVLTFTLSYPLGIAFNYFVSSIVAWNTLMSYLPRLVTVAGPAAAALIIAACGAGNIRVRALVRACRIPARHLPPLIGIIVLSAAIAGAAFVLSGMPVASVIRTAKEHPLMLLMHLAVQSVVIGLGEEIGWRGWLLPSLAQTRSLVLQPPSLEWFGRFGTAPSSSRVSSWRSRLRCFWHRSQSSSRGCGGVVTAPSHSLPPRMVPRMAHSSFWSRFLARRSEGRSL